MEFNSPKYECSHVFIARTHEHTPGSCSMWYYIFVWRHRWHCPCCITTTCYFQHKTVHPVGSMAAEAAGRERSLAIQVCLRLVFLQPPLRGKHILLRIHNPDETFSTCLQTITIWNLSKCESRIFLRRLMSLLSADWWKLCSNQSAGIKLRKCHRNVTSFHL